MKRTAGVIALAIAVTAPVKADLSQWHSLGTSDFSQCYTETQCCLDSQCTDHELVFGGNCGAGCGETCRAHGGFLYGDSFNRIVGSTVHEIFVGNFGPASDAEVDIFLVDPETLLLDYQLIFGEGQGPPLQPPLPNVEVVVFRFAGDPTVFEGLGPLNLLALLNLGIIDNEDVLFFDNLTDDGAVGVAEVGVAGVPPSEIVVMASGHGVVPSSCPSQPVPTTGLGATLLLLAAMFTAWVVVFRRELLRSR
jgi:hypothetical protein